MLTPIKANHLFINWFHFAATYVDKPVESREMSHPFSVGNLTHCTKDTAKDACG